MSKKFVGIQSIDTVRVGKRTFAFGIYQDAKVGRIPFAGLAEKCPTDKENATRGRNFAIGRALETLGKAMQKKEWEHLKRNGRTIKGKKLSAKEVSSLKNSLEAKTIREARIKKHVKESSEACKSQFKKGNKSSKTV